jgi:hypothetical protein
MSFHLPNMATLRKALAHLKSLDADIEDPSDEIGPEAPGSKNMGLWFHDPDGYRWELSVLHGKYPCDRPVRATSGLSASPNRVRTNE